MDYNDQRRHDKSWNDPPMFSVEQINQAVNTAPTSKRYRYPQPPLNQQPAYQNPYPQAGSMNSFGNYNNNPAMTPATGMYPGQQQQQYPPTSYAPYGNTPQTSYGAGIQQPVMPQNYSYPSQFSPQNNPYNAVSSTGVPTAPIQSPPATNNVIGYPMSSSSAMPSPYATTPLMSNPMQSAPLSTTMATNPPIGFNMNAPVSIGQTPPVIPESNPGFNYNQSQHPQQQQYPYGLSN